MEIRKILSFPPIALAKLLRTAKGQQSHQSYDKCQGNLELLLWSRQVSVNACVSCCNYSCSFMESLCSHWKCVDSTSSLIFSYPLILKIGVELLAYWRVKTAFYAISYVTSKRNTNKLKECYNFLIPFLSCCMLISVVQGIQFPLKWNAVM